MWQSHIKKATQKSTALAVGRSGQNHRGEISHDKAFPDEKIVTFAGGCFWIRRATGNIGKGVMSCRRVGPVGHRGKGGNPQNKAFRGEGLLRERIKGSGYWV
jgi:hypothetical protein